MHPLETFVWGVMGSVAVELITLLGYYHSRPIQLPKRYSKIGFWITRIVLALLAGAVAVGYDIHQRILAFNVGAATPLIVTFMARGLRPGSTTAALLRPKHPGGKARPPASDKRVEQDSVSAHHRDDSTTG